MIGRYSSPPMTAIFSDEARLGLWLEVEILAVEAWAKLGVIPEDDARAIRLRAPTVDAHFVAEVNERERITDHDVAAFVDVVQEAVGAPAGNWVHHGLTSTDVVDTAQSVTLVRAADLLLEAADGLVAALKRRAIEHVGTPMLGRTHGMHAEPTTFGAKLALFCLQVDRDRTRLRRAREAVAVGKLSGAVGTYSNIDPEIENQVCAALGLRPVPATQVLARDRHAEYLYACASMGTAVETIATELRHLQRSELSEVEEPFQAGQKGSSAMPHKRNPITSERLVGMSRVLRGYLVAGLEDVALWHERDISHSSVERIVLPDASQLAYYSMRRMARLIDGLVVHEERMAENLLVGSLGLVFSQPVLLALVASGLTRDAAYRIVQDAAHRSSEERVAFRSVLESDAELVDALGEIGLPLCSRRPSTLERALRNAHRVNSRRARGRRVSVVSPLYSGKVREIYDDRPGAAAARGLGPDLGLRPGVRTADPRQGERVPHRVMTTFYCDGARRALRRRTSCRWTRLSSATLANRDRRTFAGTERCSCDAPEMLPVECIVRGYITGSAWREYTTSGTMHGQRRSPPASSRPIACRSRSSRPRPRRPRATTRTSPSRRVCQL